MLKLLFASYLKMIAFFNVKIMPMHLQHIMRRDKLFGICDQCITINYNIVSPARELLLTALPKTSATKQDPNYVAKSQEPGPEAVNPLSHSTHPNTKLQTLQGEKQRHRPDCMEAQADLSLSVLHPTGCKIFKVSLRMRISQGICSFGGSGGPQFTFLYHPFIPPLPTAARNIS